VEGKNWETDILLRADAHRDSVDAKTSLERRHLREAKKRNALIIDIGDAFDVMQARGDPRGTKSELKEKLKEDNYLNLVTDDSFEFYKPYAKNWLMMSSGNHEWAVLKYHGYDLVGELIKDLNEKTGSHIYNGGIEGWIKFQFIANGTQRQSFNLFYTHGAGGDAPVTKGVIRTARRSVYLPDAHIILSGHNHNAWAVYTERLRLSDQGKAYEDEQLHIQLPGYKGRGGHEKRNERPPKPIGAYWLNFKREGRERMRYRAYRV